MANFNAKSQIQQVSSLGVGVGLGISQEANRLGLHDTRPQSLSENGIQLDPLSIRITLVIVFVTIFLLVILIIFIVICIKRHSCIGSKKNPNCEDNSEEYRLRSNRTRYNTRDNEGSLPRPRTVSNESENSFMNDNEDYLHGINYTSSTTSIEKVSKKSRETRSQQPDIIEAEIHFVPSYHVYDYAYDHRIYGPSNEQTKPQVQCDKPNECDVSCYRPPHESVHNSPVSYHEHQDAQEAKQRNFVQHSLDMRFHLSSPPSTVSPANMGLDMPIRGNLQSEHFINSPLTRLTPSTSSGSPQHSIRILTLQDISRKQLQSVGVLLESTSSSGGISKDIVHSNSELMSWNSPIVSQFSKWSSVPKAPTESCGANNTSACVLHLDTLQDDKILPPLQPDGGSSTTTESDDSFTGSEFGGDDILQGAMNVVLKTSLVEKHVDVAGNTEPIATRPTSLPDRELYAFSMLTSDDCSVHKSEAPSLQSLEYLLNWSVDFESLMDVFQDLAELPDLEPEGSQSKQSAPKSCEIYV